MTSHTLSLEPGEAKTMQALRLKAIVDNLNNILTVISAHSTLLKANVTPGDPHEENLAGINDAVKCAAGLTRRLGLIAENSE